MDHDPRRLEGVPDAVYTVRDGALHRRTERSAAPPSGPHMVVEVQGPRSAALSAEALRAVGSAEETAPGRHRLTVAVSHSDVLLRTLLTDRHPWHVVSVHPATATPDESPR